MDSSTDHTAETHSEEFSFGTNGSSLGFDAETMRIHSRALVIQSKHRAQRVIDLNHHDARHDRDALIDLAAQGERQNAEATHPEKRGPSLRHLQAISRFDSHEELAPIDLEATSEELDLRDRSALLDLRREHESVTRRRIKIMSDTQPRSAVADRRWG